MDSFVGASQKLHIVCVTFPTQGHITPMLQIAKLLHQRGFRVTFANTKYNHKRILKARGSDALNASTDFCFETIPDGLLPVDADVTQDIPSLFHSILNNISAPFLNFLNKLNSSPIIPPVTCVVSDSGMPFILQAAEDLGIPVLFFWAMSAWAFLGYSQYSIL